MSKAPDTGTESTRSLVGPLPVSGLTEQLKYFRHIHFWLLFVASATVYFAVAFYNDAPETLTATKQIQAAFEANNHAMKQDDHRWLRKFNQLWVSHYEESLRRQFGGRQLTSEAREPLDATAILEVLTPPVSSIDVEQPLKSALQDIDDGKFTARIRRLAGCEVERRDQLDEYLTVGAGYAADCDLRLLSHNWNGGLFTGTIHLSCEDRGPAANRVGLPPRLPKEIVCTTQVETVPLRLPPGPRLRIESHGPHLLALSIEDARLRTTERLGPEGTFSVLPFTNLTVPGRHFVILPILQLALLVYFVVALRQFRVSLLDPIPKLVQPWIGTSTAVGATVLTFVTLSVLPGMSTGFAVYRQVLPPIAGGATASLAVAMGILQGLIGYFAFRETRLISTRFE